MITNPPILFLGILSFFSPPPLSVCLLNLHADGSYLTPVCFGIIRRAYVWVGHLHRLHRRASATEARGRGPHGPSTSPPPRSSTCLTTSASCPTAMSSTERSARAWYRTSIDWT
jgi:hypothetical protein